MWQLSVPSVTFMILQIQKITIFHCIDFLAKLKGWESHREISPWQPAVTTGVQKYFLPDFPQIKKFFNFQLDTQNNFKFSPPRWSSGLSHQHNLDPG